MTADKAKHFQRKDEARVSSDRTSYEYLSLLDRSYSAEILVRALARKARRRLFGLSSATEAAYRFGFVVFDRPDLNGGGPGFGQDYIRVLAEIGIDACDRLFEFCSGPGYIGYSLLARGLCKSLVLADVNPIAVQAARKSAEFNRILHRVTIYLSDGLDQIPDSEKWDLVVGNPPHFIRWPGNSQLRCEDTDWQLHRKFYLSVRKFLKPGARVLLQENAIGSSPEVFEPMIRKGGGKLVQTQPGPDIGRGGKMYYMLSSWD